MKHRIYHFSLPKIGHDESEYEDAYAPKYVGEQKSKIIHAAISDGATESVFASYWARMLTRRFIIAPYITIDAIKEEIEQLSTRWNRIIRRKKLPWYVEEKARYGAHATLLGLIISPGYKSLHRSGKWVSVAVGDSCLFHIRGGKLLHSFPLHSSDEFDNTPALLSTILPNNKAAWDETKFKRSEWKSCDTFFLATDALAQCFLTMYEKKDDFWGDLIEIVGGDNPDSALNSLVTTARDSSELKNDDITLVSIQL